MIIYLSLLVCVIGLVLYCFARPEQSKTAEVGRIMFAFGLLAFLLSDSAVLGVIRHG